MKSGGGLDRAREPVVRYGSPTDRLGSGDTACARRDTEAGWRFVNDGVDRKLLIIKKQGALLPVLTGFTFRPARLRRATILLVAVALSALALPSLLATAGEGRLTLVPPAGPWPPFVYVGEVRAGGIRIFRHPAWNRYFYPCECHNPEYVLGPFRMTMIYP